MNVAKRSEKKWSGRRLKSVINDANGKIVNGRSAAKAVSVVKRGTEAEIVTGIEGIETESETEEAIHHAVMIVVMIVMTSEDATKFDFCISIISINTHTHIDFKLKPN